LSAFFRFTASDYPFDIFWLPLWYLLITPLVSSDYPLGIFWLPLWYPQILLDVIVTKILHSTSLGGWTLRNIYILRRFIFIIYHQQDYYGLANE
jgi:hypothetical protein